MTNFLHKHNYTQEIIIASDNLELIKRTKQYHMNVYQDSHISNAPHMDIQDEINFLLTSHFTNLTIVHVNGHQDTKKNNSLTWLEYLNVRADKLATIA